MITFPSARKLSSYLVRNKLCQLARAVGSSKCNGKQCEVRENAAETSSFTSTVFKNMHR